MESGPDVEHDCYRFFKVSGTVGDRAKWRGYPDQESKIVV
jgi:hypothetical protein